MMKNLSLPSPVLSALGALTFLSASASASAITFGLGGAISPPDNVPAGASSSIVVGTAGTIASFNSLTLFGFTHTWLGDLVVTLSDGTTTIDILDRVGRTPALNVGSPADLSGDFVFNLTGVPFPTPGNVAVAGASGPFLTSINGTAGGSSSANGSFADFVGKNVAATWVLKISDNLGDDTGGITGWQFNVTTSAAGVPDAGSTIGMLGAAMAALAGFRYRNGK